MGSYDIAIAGAGPAGLAAAIHLSRGGARVAVVGLPPGVARIEGASPRTTALLTRLGVALHGAGVGPLTPRRVDWGDAMAATNAEHAVDRAALDRALADLARDAGVTVIAARCARLAPTRKSLCLADGRTIPAGLLVEARGRRARAGNGRRRGPATVALAGFSGLSPDNGAAITARPGGWCWIQGMPDGQRWVQVVADAAEVARDGAAAVWARLAPEGAAIPQDLRSTACELRLSAPDLPPGLLVLGDAAVATDPLSGHGLFWALSSARAAVPMARAMLDGQADLAARFHRDRVAETFWRQARIGRDFHRAARPAPNGFWTPRRAWPDDAPAHSPPPEAPRWREAVVVEGDRLRLLPVLETALDPGGVAFVADVPLATIAARLGGRPVPDRDSLTRLLPDLPSDRAALLHGWLAARGLAGRPLPDPGTTTT